MPPVFFAVAWTRAQVCHTLILTAMAWGEANLGQYAIPLWRRLVHAGVGAGALSKRGVDPRVVADLGALADGGAATIRTSRAGADGPAHGSAKASARVAAYEVPVDGHLASTQTPTTGYVTCVVPLALERQSALHSLPAALHSSCSVDDRPVPAAGDVCQPKSSAGEPLAPVDRNALFAERDAVLDATSGRGAVARALCIAPLLVSSAILVGIGAFTLHKTASRPSRAGMAAAVALTLLCLVAAAAATAVFFVAARVTTKLEVRRYKDMTAQRKRTQEQCQAGDAPWRGFMV